MKTKSRSTEFALGAALDTLELIGNRWTLRVLGALEHAGTLRYNEVQRAVDGISQRMLTLALRNLEQGGLVARTHYATFPPRVDYEITRLGRELSGQLRELQAWIQANGVPIPAAQERFHGRSRSRRKA
jgi:DNA-binding HxlR family transcriptional regulator